MLQFLLWCGRPSQTAVLSAPLSVCSTTLWVGQLDKRTQQQDVACLLEEFGQIESINMIPPRGCAYIVMVHRQDAFRALQKLSRGPYKVNQKTIKIAWALNKGIKAEYKQYWDVELGVTYIPWNKVKPEDLESFREGGMLDGDTLCPEWKGLLGVDVERPGERAQNGGLEPAHAEDAAAAAASSRAQVKRSGFQVMRRVKNSPPAPAFASSRLLADLNRRFSQAAVEMWRRALCAYREVSRVENLLNKKIIPFCVCVQFLS